MTSVLIGRHLDTDILWKQDYLKTITSHEEMLQKKITLITFDLCNTSCTYEKLNFNFKAPS
jgi:hypothetical protein